MQLQTAWPPPDAPHAPSAGVLVVDDDPLTLDLLWLALPSWGFRVWSAPGPEEALRLLCRHKEAIDAVVLAVRLPGCTGPALLAHLRRAWGELPAVFVSLPWGLDLPGLAEAPLLPKPLEV